MQLSFGSGEVVARLVRDAAGNALTASTPIRVQGLQEMSLDFSGDLKEFHGQNRYALASAMGKVKCTGKMKGALLNGYALNSLYFGGTLAGGTMKSVYADVVGVVAAASLTTVAATDTGVVGAAFVDDLGVIGSNGIAFTKVASAPSVGQYSVTVAGVYTFNAADVGTRVYRSYSYSYTSTFAKKISLDNIAMGSAPQIRLDYVTTFQGKRAYLELFSIAPTKLGLFSSKNDDFSVPEIDFSCMTDDAGYSLGNIYTQE